MRYDLLLFDIDGTLVMTKGAGREATKRSMMDLFGYDGGADTHHFGGKTDWQILSELAGAQASAEVVRAKLPAYIEAMKKHLEAVIPQYPVSPCAHALDVVHALRHRPAPILGLLTGNVHSTAPVKLQAAGFDPSWFALGAYGNEALSRNDLPALAIRRAEQLSGKAIAPERVLIIGDTPQDIACARAAGVPVAVVLTGFSSREELASHAPDYLFDDMRPVLEML